MQEKIMAQQSRTAYYEALAKCQLELPVIPKRGEIKNKSGGVQSKYARWEDINEKIKSILQRHGFTLSFISIPCDNGVKVQARLSHIDGHQEESTVPAPLDVSGNKNNVQGIGSSLSYCKRYAAGLLLNITTAEEDTDGIPPNPDAVFKTDIEGVQARWKKLNPKGTKEHYEKWIEETCGLLKPFDSKSWRLADLHACEVKLDGMEGK